MKEDQNEEDLLRAAALQNASAILSVGQRSEAALLEAKEQLEKKTEQLAQSLAIVRATLESTTDAILVVDEQGQVTDWNTQFLELWRLPLSLVESREDRRILDFAAGQTRNPDAFLARVKEIESAASEDSFDLVELSDGRVFERYSRVQRMQSRKLGRVWSFRDVTARKKAEDAQREQREWFQVTLSSIGDAVITTDTESIVTFFNPVAEAMTGWTMAEAVGRPLHEVFSIVHETTRESVINPIHIALTEGRIVGLANSTALISRDGSETAIEDSAAPIRDGNGKITGAVMVFHDVTERRKAHEALAETSRRLQLALEAGRLGDWEWDARTDLITLGPLAAKIFDLPAAHPIKWSELQSLLRAEELERARPAAEEAIRNRTQYKLEYRHQRGTGEVSWLEVNGCGNYSSTGQILGLTGVVQDITETKRIEEALRGSEEQLRATFNQAAVGIAIAQSDGRFEEVNKRFTEIVGYSAEELTELTFQDLTHPEDLAATEAFVQELWAGKISDYALEQRFLRKDGSTVWSYTSVTVLKDRQGRPNKLIGIIEDITERQKAQEVNSRLAALVESSDDAIISKTLEGVIRTWNAGAERIFGYDPSEVIGQPVSILIPPDRIDEEPGILDRLKNGERIDHYETIRKRKDGTFIDVSLTVSPVKDATGRIVGASKIARDITERRRSEIARKKSEEQLRLITDATPGLIGYINSDYRYVFVNQQYELWFASRREEIVGKHAREVLGDPAFEQLKPHMEAAFAGNDIHIELEVPYRLAGNRFVDIFYIPDFDENRNVRGIYVRVIDITHRKQIEDALRDETRVLELLNSTGTAIASQLDLESLVQTITNAATELSGAKFGAFFYNVINNESESFILYALSGAPREAFEKMGLPRSTPVFSHTFHGEGILRSADITKDPRYGTVSPHYGMPQGLLSVRSYLAVPVISRSGEVIGGLFFGHPDTDVFTEKSERLIAGVAAQATVAIDNARLYEAAQKEIAQRRQTEEELAAARDSAQAANRAKDQFLAALSHELRTPLTPVLAILSSMHEEGNLPAPTSRDLETIRRNVELEARLIDDLLDLSRIISGKLELHAKTVPAVQLIADALNTCESEIQAKSLLVVKEIQSGLTVEADRARITQVLWNLLKNSIKFTPVGGTILLRAQSTGSGTAQRLNFEVRDTGMGIEPSEIGRIFDAFEQANRKVTQQFGGLGLGLAISRAIAEAHGGEITAFSEGLGRGSTFVLSLPVGKPIQNNSAPSQEIPAPSSSDGAPLKILLVEDHADTASVLVRLLERMGHQVTHAGTVAAALRIAREAMDGDGLNLVISDLGLPDASGLELMRELSTRYQLPGIALSGYGMDSDLRESAAAGFSHHLIKPVEIGSLRQVIAASVCPK